MRTRFHQRLGGVRLQKSRWNDDSGLYPAHSLVKATGMGASCVLGTDING